MSNGAPPTDTWVPTTPLLPSDEWVPSCGCEPAGPVNSIATNVVLTGVPATVTSVANDQSIWAVNLNDGAGNFSIDRYSSGTYANSPMTISAAGVVQFNNPVLLSEDPVTSNEAATKNYVDQIGVTGPWNAPPLMDGTAAAGVSTLFTRGDHVHPTDTTRAPLISPAFSGTPTAPTVTPANDSSTKIATTAFVQAAVGALGVSSWNGRTGAVTMTLADVTGVGGAPLASPAITGAPTAPTPVAADNSTALATTAFVKAQGYALGSAVVSSFNTRTGAVTMTAADITGVGGALLASPTFTGTPAAPTPAIGDNSTTLATTAFVKAQGYAPATGGSYVAKAGDTMTGALTVALPSSGGAGSIIVAPIAGPGGAGITLNHPTGNYASFLVGQAAGKTRWNVNFGNNTGEGGSNAGSDFSLVATADDGSTSLGTYLTITRANGNATFTGALAVAPPSGAATINLTTATANNCAIQMAKPSNANGALIGAYSGTGTITAANLRWQWVFELGVEGSGNSGSDFQLQNYDNNGTTIGTPLSIIRSSGQTTFNSLSGTWSIVRVNKPASGSQAGIGGYTNLSQRWNIIMAGDTTAEANVSDGSNFALQRYNNSGAYIDNPITCVRSTGQCSFSVAIINGPSDRRVKENIAPLEGSLDKILKLQGMSFNFITAPEKREIGLIAQDVEPVVPEVIQRFNLPDHEGEERLAIDYPKLVAHLIEAVKTLSARIEALEARLA